MTLYATIYDFVLQHTDSHLHSRVDCYVRLNNGQLIVLTEEGSTKHLSEKYDFEIFKNDFTGFKGKSCELIQDSHGIRFRKLIKD